MHPLSNRKIKMAKASRPRQSSNSPTQVEEASPKEETSSDLIAGIGTLEPHDPIRNLILSACIQAGVSHLAERGELFDPSAEKRLSKKLDKIILVAEMIQDKLDKK